MKTEELYDLAEKHGYAVVSCFLPETESLCVEIDGRCYIGIDPHLCGDTEKEHLAHELGHVEYGGFYNVYSGCDEIGRAERKASKWAIVHLCPLADLRDCKGMSIWEAAERFGVSVKFMTDAICFYKDAGVLN